MTKVRSNAKSAFRIFVPAIVCFLIAAPGWAQRRMENLNRGLAAFMTGPNQAYVSWRLLATDSPQIAFNVYRSTGGAAPTRLNAAPITTTTDFVDGAVDSGQTNRYFVRPVLHGVELAPSESFTLPANTPVRQYLEIPVQQPPQATNVCGGTATYSANDGSVADLDGDGEYEIVLKWDPSDSRDSASSGCSNAAILDAYKINGALLWRINLGPNIRAGAHYTQFMVYDLDGDGKAEVVMKTADGTVDGVGHVIGDASKIWVDTDPSSSTFGRINSGPEYLTVFSGETGAALATTTYIPGRDPLDGWGGFGGNCNNDSIGNRADRFLAAVAYLDGERPSVVMARGYYGRSVLAAWDFRNGKLTSRWVFDSENRDNPFSGQGNHNLSVADVDGDGKDEIVYGSMVVDDDGTGLFSTGLRHGDALHVSRFDPSNPDLLVFGVHENESRGSDPRCFSPGDALYNARTGEILWSDNFGIDEGRGMASALDDTRNSAQFWASSLHDIRGNVISPTTPSSTNFGIWWDADLLRELEDRTSVTKWDPQSQTTTTLLSGSDVSSNNGSKATPVLAGDILGDWREEVIWRTSDNHSLRIYSTVIPASNRLPALAQDPQYRLALAWQNVGYNQPPWPSFYIGPGMSYPPPPNIVTHPSAATAITSSLAAKSGPLDARVWTIAVQHRGAGIAQQVEINNVRLTQTAGASCTPAVLPKPPAYPPAFPIVIGDLDPNAAANAKVTIDFSGCSSDARFLANIAISANGGPAAPLVRANQAP